jgi:dsDNA-specific endonuclease/ATPase MutS2
VLELKDLSDIRTFTYASERIRKYLAAYRQEFPPNEDEYSTIHPLEKLNTLMQESITDNGEINEDKFTILKKIRKEIFTARQDLEKKISG